MADIHVSDQNQVKLVEAKGRIDSSNAGELGEVLNSVLDEGALQVVIDFSAVDFMSSAGVRELVSALKRIRRSQGDIRLAQPSDRVYEVLEMVGLNKIFQIYPGQAEAVGSF